MGTEVVYDPIIVVYPTHHGTVECILAGPSELTSMEYFAFNTASIINHIAKAYDKAPADVFEKVKLFLNHEDVKPLAEH